MQYRISVRNHLKLKSREKSFVHNIRSNNPIVLKYCTEHDSVTAVHWARFQNDWKFETYVKGERVSDGYPILHSIPGGQHVIDLRQDSSICSLLGRSIVRFRVTTSRIQHERQVLLEKPCSGCRIDRLISRRHQSLWDSCKIQSFEIQCDAHITRPFFSKSLTTDVGGGGGGGGF